MGNIGEQVKKYRLVHRQGEAIEVDHLLERESPFEPDEKLNLTVTYNGLLNDKEAVVHIPGHGNFAVDLKNLGVKRQ
jgi:hypothetical protein